MKWIESRTEALTSSTQSPRQNLKIQLALRKDGTMLGIKVREVVDEGADPEFAAYHTQGRLQTIVGLYRIHSVRLEGSAVLTNTCPSGPNRGVAKPAMGFALERIVNVAAKVVGLDPIEFRLRNYIKPSQFPYTTPTGQRYDSGDYESTLNELLAKSNLHRWLEFKKAARSERRFIGIGIATCVEPGGYNSAGSFLITGKLNKTGGYEAASIQMDRDGKVLVSLSSPDAGQGHATSVSQIVAGILGVDLADIQVLDTFDTFHSPYGGMSGNYANKFSVLDLSAAVGAASKLRDKIITIASKLLKVDKKTLRLKSGEVICVEEPDKKVKLSDIATIAYFDVSKLPETIEPGLHQTFFYASPFADPPDSLGRISTKITFGSSAHLAVIEIDPDTGKIQILHYEVVHDCGRLVNPSIVDGQIQGSTAHGVAATLQEEFAYDSTGQPLSTTFMDYLAATSVETPNIVAGHLETPSPHSLLGTKGMGEGGATPPLAAIYIALDDCIGLDSTKLCELPLTPERVLNMVRSAISRTS